MAPRLEKLAASELQSYLKKLYGIETPVQQSVPADGLVFWIGSPETNSLIDKEAVGWPSLSSQGLVLRTVRLKGRPGVLVGGGSPLATLWAVYQLVEKFGVRYLLWGDVLPEKPGPFQLPKVDETWEPVFPVRAFRGVNDFVIGPEAWSLKEYRRVLAQLVKLKYNELWLSFYPYHPFVDYDFRGQRKSTAELWFGWQYPIDGDTIGRHWFGDAKEFIHPEFKGAITYEQKVAAGQRYVHGILKLAKEFGLKTAILFSATDPPQEFKERLREWTPPEFAREKPMEEPPEFGYLGAVTVGADPRNTAFQNVFNPVLAELAEVIIRAYVNTYPEADAYIIHTPEHRASVSGLEDCWKRLDGKYDIEKTAPLQGLLASARRRSRRAERELGGDIEFLYFLDQLFTERKVLAHTARPDAPVVISGVTRELYPILPKVLPAHFKVLISPEAYTTVESVAALDSLAPFRQSPVKATFWLTLQGDSMAVLPQLPSSSIHRAVEAMQRYGLEGFMVRYWTLGDLVPTTAYLARIAWGLMDPTAFYADHIKAICGAQAVPDVLAGFEAIDEATRFLAQRRPDGRWIIYGNPMPGLLEEHYHVKQAGDPVLAKALEIYGRALDHLRRGHAKSSAHGRKYLDYFVARVEMGIHYLQLLQTIQELGVAFREGQEARRGGAPAKVLAQRRAVKALAARSVDLARETVSVLVPVVRDESDRGLLVCLNTVLYKYAKARALVMEQEAERGFPPREHQD